ncbi:MAG: hypothetical protein KU37_11890 [Sulfuricurvum sp. PC08-66]|nr:MAG: hypothetical protein KU37_11890 [Sulfuricurvum sp. PC08-66]
MNTLHRSLSKQLLVSILRIYLILTVVVTLAHILIEYQYAKSAIQKELVSIGAIFEPALNTALWELNDEQVATITDGIYAMPLLFGVHIAHPDGRVLHQKMDEHYPALQSTSLQYRFDIHHTLDNTHIFLATVTLYSNEQAIFERLKVNFFMLVLNAFIKSAALLFLFYLAFRKYLQRPLGLLTGEISTIKSALGEKRLITKSFPHNNEISLLKEEFNALLRHLYTREQKQIDTLKEFNRMLEERVQERTLALENANQTLQMLSTTDTLTHLANRSKLNALLLEAEKSFHKAQKPFALIMIDIDSFKAINDTYGHLVGDHVLTSLAHLLTSTLPANVIAGRWGGEEFLVICNGYDSATAHSLAQTLQQSVQNYPIDTVGHITISLGVSAFRSQSTLEECMRQADDALYESKKRGKNCVTLLA